MTVKPVLRDHCHEKPPVLKDHILLTEVPQFNATEPVTKDLSPGIDRLVVYFYGQWGTLSRRVLLYWYLVSIFQQIL